MTAEVKLYERPRVVEALDFTACGMTDRSKASFEALAPIIAENRKRLSAFAREVEARRRK